MKWVHCDSHGAVHRCSELGTWCTAAWWECELSDVATLLDYDGDDLDKAIDAARAKGLWIYLDEERT